MTGGWGTAGFAAAVSLILLAALLARHAHRLRLRLESLATPLHELRGALSALELGLAVVERSLAPHPERDGCIDVLRLSLARAVLAAQDVDSIRDANGFIADAHTELDLSALVLRSARAWSRLAPCYDARLDVDWRAGPVPVHGDSTRLRQAFDNLLANALEHGGRSVFVEGELSGGPHSQRVVRVTISDGGPGLARPLEEMLFERSRSSRGHGLRITSGVVAEHGGSLRLGAGRNGPAFVVELPVAGTAARSAAPTDRPVARPLARAA
jgi:signal transduction histidine kinase